MGINAWDMVKVPFPYTNRPIEQFRPAVVIGLYKTDGAPFLLWVLMVTSATHRRWHGDVEISDLQGSGLPKPSIIRTSKIATIEAVNAQHIGRLRRTERQVVQEYVGKILRLEIDTFDG